MPRRVDPSSNAMRQMTRQHVLEELPVAVWPERSRPALPRRRGYLEGVEMGVSKQ